MPLDLHTVETPDGSTQAYQDRMVLGVLNNYPVPQSPAAISTVTVTSAGTLYTAVPTLSVSGDGTGATLVAHMKALTAVEAAAGTGYSPGDTITFTGGTETTNSIVTITNTKLVSAAVNAAGTGYAPTDTITVSGGTETVNAILNVATTKLISTAVLAAGSGYAINDTLTMVGGTHATAAILTLTHSQLVSVALNAAGTGYAPGDTITLAGGTAGTAAIVTVDTAPSGIISTFHISTPGDYTVQATSFTQASSTGIGTGATFNTGLFGVLTLTVSTAGSYTVNSASFTSTGGAGTGATFNTAVYGVLTVTINNGGVYTTNASSYTQGSTSGVGTGASFTTLAYGVNVVSVTTAGSYTVLPTNPVAQGASSAGGTGATFNVTSWGIGTITVSAGGSGYDNTSALVVTNHSGDTTGNGGAGTLVLATNVNDPVTATITLPTSANLPMINGTTPNYGVIVNPGQNCYWYVDPATKTSNSFNVVLTPISGAALTSGTMDILITG